MKIYYNASSKHIPKEFLETFLAKYKNKLRSMIEDPVYDADIEKLREKKFRGADIYSMRLNGKQRVLFALLSGR